MAHSAASVLREWVAPLLKDAGFRKVGREYRLEPAGGGMVLLRARPFPLRPAEYATFRVEVDVAPPIAVEYFLRDLPEAHREVGNVDVGLWWSRLMPGDRTWREVGDVDDPVQRRFGISSLWWLPKEGNAAPCGQDLHDQARDVVLRDAVPLIDPANMLTALREAGDDSTTFRLGRDLAEALLLATWGDSPRVRELLSRVDAGFPEAAPATAWIRQRAAS